MSTGDDWIGALDRSAAPARDTAQEDIRQAVGRAWAGDSEWTERVSGRQRVALALGVAAALLAVVVAIVVAGARNDDDFVVTTTPTTVTPGTTTLVITPTVSTIAAPLLHPSTNVTTPTTTTRSPATTVSVTERAAPVATTGPPPSNARFGSWTRLPQAPLAPRGSHTAIWTGTEVIVWGGISANGGWTEFADGAAFDPVAGTWRTIAPAPIAGRGGHTAVWTGTEMLVWGGIVDGGCGTASSDGAAYDPLADAWRVLPTGGMGRDFHTAVWTGTEMLVVGGVASGGEPVPGTGLCNPPAQPQVALDDVAYDPATDTWRAIAPRPWQGTVLDSATAWDGTRLLLWSGRDALDVSSEPWTRRGYAYDPAVDQWIELAPAPLSPRSDANSVWTGRELIVAGGQDAVGLTADGAAYDPESDSWRPVAPMPDGWTSANTVWTGDVMLLVGGFGRGASAAAAYDPATDTWTVLPTPPFEGCDPLICSRYDAPLVWTGDSAVVWGGYQEVSNGEGGDPSWNADGAVLR